MSCCDNCQLKYSNLKNQLNFVGVENPDIYFVGYGIGEDEANSGNLFDTVDPGNKLFLSTLLDLGLFGKSRFAKLVRCRHDNRKVTDEQIYNCAQSMIEDIKKSNPKVIVALGSKPAEYFLVDKFVSLSTQAGKAFKIEIDDKSYPLVMTYAPGYVISQMAEIEEDVDDIDLGEGEESSSSFNDFDIVDKFNSDLIFAGRLANGELCDISQKNIKTAMNYFEFLEYYNEHLKDAEIIAYDVETNALDPRFDSFKIIGFSLSPNPNTGIYITKKALECTMSDSDWDRIVLIVKNLLQNKNIIVHNSMYEIPSTLNNWDFRIENFEDTLVMARLLLGGRTGAGLKEQAQRNCGYPEWEEELINYRNRICELLNIFKPTPTGKDRPEFLDLISPEKGNSSFRQFKNYLEPLVKAKLDEFDAFVEAKEYTPKELKERKEALDKNKNYKIYKILNNLESQMKQFYTDPVECENILELVIKEVINLKQCHIYGFIPYSSIPLKILSQYGAIDAIATSDLYIELSKQLTAKSTDKVDLWRGYEVMKEQYKVAASMEINGLYWNDEIATRENKWFVDTAVEHMRGMMNSGFLDDKIMSAGKTYWIKYLVENNENELCQILNCDTYKLSKTGIKINGKGREIRFSKIPPLIDKSYWDSHRDLILNYMKKIVFRTFPEFQGNYENYKNIFNPGSPHQEDFLNTFLVDDDLKVAHLMDGLNLLSEDSNFNIDSYGPSERKLFEALNPPFDEDNPISDRERFLHFKEALQNCDKIESEDLRNLVAEKLDYHLSSGQEAVFIRLYNNFMRLGLYDIEDPSTWSPEFKFLLDFRIYKKCIKLISTYISGKKVGRGHVTVVNRSDIDENKPLAKRESWYKKDIPDDKCYIMQSSYGVCTADSFRWRSGFHTIPSASSIKNFYTSRFKGGVIFEPDFSQMELRVLAGTSNCKSMNDAFANGIDIHRYNASKIFNKEMDEVSSAERRYAKQFSFSIVYGASPEGAGKEYLKGDVERARQIFDSFYEQFPEIKDWIAERHREGKKYNRVSCPETGMFVGVPNKSKQNENALMRFYQNAPIQSMGSNMAGYTLSSIDSYIRANNLRSKTILFIHDSLEFDVHPMEFFEMAKYVQDALDKVPMDKFGILAKADLELGISLGQGLGGTHLECDEDMQGGSIVLEGTEENFNALIDNWKSIYSKVEWEDLKEPEDEYIPWSNLFIPKGTINKQLGTTVKNIERKVTIRY